MLNKEIFTSDSKYEIPSSTVKSEIEVLDSELEKKNYIYEAVWRDDREQGGYVFVFQLPQEMRRYSNKKNLLTLRPQSRYLNIEVYWGEKSKHYYRLYEGNQVNSQMLEYLELKHSKISNCRQL